jgi:hypothetical protein
MLNNFFSLLSGLIFGIGLTISNMTNPDKVISFLDISGKWDPSLIFVMLGAIIFCAPMFYFLRIKTKPFFSSKFELPSKSKIDKHLIIGSSLFGIGWGMVGLCPGPAISSLALFQPLSILFVFALIVGFYISKFFQVV